MNIKWRSSFTVYPEDCNYMKIGGIPMVHGGAMLMKMDRTAAECVRRFLYDSQCDSARTVGIDKLAFLDGAILGDIIVLKCEIVSLGIKQIKVDVVAVRDRDKKTMSIGRFSFCSFLNDNPHPHGLVLL